MSSLRALLVFFVAIAVAPGAVRTASALSADSLRQEVSRLASQGRLDEALDQVEQNASELPASWTAMFRGKLELDGDKSARGYKNAAADTSPPQMRGEAVFRQGQYHYAAGRYHLAIPQFREYLARYPTGVWSEASAYWMAYACLQHAQQKRGREAYLDSAQSYLRKLEFRGRSGYYWPLARAAQGRVLLVRGDTVGALRALRDARSKAPAEETPGILLLSLQAERQSPQAGQWEDSLRWSYPLSPETRLLGAAQPRPVRPAAPAPAVTQDHVATPAAAPQKPGGWSLQLGVFSQQENARKFVKDLAAKKITARIEPMKGRTGTMHRVLSGSFASEAAAVAEGKRTVKPAGFEYRVVAP